MLEVVLLLPLLALELTGVDVAKGLVVAELTGDDIMPYEPDTGTLPLLPPVTINGVPVTDGAARLVITDTFIALPPSRITCCCCCGAMLPLLPPSVWCGWW